MPGTDASNDFNALKKDIEQLRTDLAHTVETLKTIGAEKGQAGVERMRAAGRDAAAQAKAFQETTEKYIEARPLSSVLAAFGTGFVVGMLLDRRH